MRNKIFLWLRKFRKTVAWIWRSFPLPCEFGSCGKNVKLIYPLRIYNPSTVFIEENVKLTHGLKLINSPTEKIIIKKYSVLAADCTIVTNNHRSTVTIPQFVLGASHVNDKSANVVIDEDVWVGTGVIILSGVHIGRGSIIGAGSLVTKDIPPYSVVSGSPAKIVKKKFSNRQILKHEKALYKKTECMSLEQLEQLDELYFKNMEIYGIDNNIDEEGRIKIAETKKMLNYINPELDN